MADEKPTTPPAAEPPEPNVQAIALTALALVVLAIAVHLSVWGLFNLLRWQQVLATGAGGPTTQNPELPAEPRWEANPLAFRLNYEAREARLDGYAWIDRRKGIVRIPVSRALDLLARRGLPSIERKGHAR